MGLLDGVVSGVVKAVKAYSEAKKNSSSKSSSSKSSSSSSKSTSTSSSSGYTPRGSNTDSYIRDTNIDDYNAIQSAKQAYAEAQRLGDKNGMANANAAANAVRAKYGYSGGTDGSEYIGLEQEYTNPYEEAMRDVQERYDAIAEQQRRANELAVMQGTQRLENQKYGINQAFDDSARQAYIQSMQSRKNLPQQLAASGITGGASETANLGLQTNYENNLNDINTQRNNALNDIDNAITDLQNTGDLNATQQALENSQAALNAYQSLLQNKINYDENKQEKDFNAQLSTLGQYADDYQAEINRREAINPNDPLIPYLRAARQEKLNEQKLKQQTLTESQRDLAWKLFQETGIANSFIESVLGIPAGTTTLDYAKNKYDTGKPYYNPNSGSSSNTTKSNNLIPDYSSHKKYIESTFKTVDEYGRDVIDKEGILNYVMQESQSDNMYDSDAIKLLYEYGMKDIADKISKGG